MKQCKNQYIFLKFKSEKILFRLANLNLKSNNLISISSSNKIIVVRLKVFDEYVLEYECIGRVVLYA